MVTAAAAAAVAPPPPTTAAAGEAEPAAAAAVAGEAAAAEESGIPLPIDAELWEAGVVAAITAGISPTRTVVSEAAANASLAALYSAGPPQARKEVCAALESGCPVVAAAEARRLSLG